MLKRNCFLVNKALYAGCLTILLHVPVSFAERDTGQYESQFRVVDPSREPDLLRDQPPVKAEPIKPGEPGSELARQQVEKLKDNPKDQAQLLLYLGQQAAIKNNFELALTYIEQALATNALPADVVTKVKAQLPSLYAVTKQYKKFAAAYEAKAKTPAGLTAIEWIQLADTYLTLKQQRKALRAFDKAIAKEPKAPETWYLARLSLLKKLGRKKAAQAAIKELIAIFPSKLDYWLQLIQIHVNQKKWRAAASVLDLAYRQSLIEKEEHLLLYARLTNKAGWPHRAGALTQTWIDQELLPNTPNHWEEVASYWLAAREYGRAIKALNRATTLAPKSAEFFLQLGQLNLDVGLWQDAISALESALGTGRVRASLGRTHLSLGLAYYQLGDYSQSLASFNAALQQKDTAQSAEQWLNFIAQLAEANIAPTSLAGALRNAAEAGELDWASRELINRLVKPTETVRADIDVSIQAAAMNTMQAGANISSPPGLNNANAAPDNEFVAIKLGPLLTPVGATQAASPDSEIPAWTGGITPDKAPAGHKKFSRPTNPYSAEKPLYTINQSNMAQYESRLSTGHKALLKKFPTYNLPVYPSHRSAAYPPAVYEATIDNANSAELVGTESIKNAKLGFPFPLPANGAEVLWNHKMRFRGTSRTSITSSALVEDGKYKLSLGKQQVYFAYGDLTEPVSTDESNRLVYGLFQKGTGKRSSGVALVHEPADHQRQQRKIWVGGSGSRGRLITVPFISYDFPIQGGGMFIDQIDMYNGAFDYYSWKLVGKRSMIIPYNAYETIAKNRTYKDSLQEAHYNQAATRYELHRVWIVDAELRSGESHKLPRRRFYIDEDTWTIVMAENYNEADELHKFQEAHPYAVYDQPFTDFSLMLVYDLLNSDYFAVGLNNEHPFWVIDKTGLTAGDFTPNKARRMIQ